LLQLIKGISFFYKGCVVTIECFLNFKILSIKKFDKLEKNYILNNNNSYKCI